MEVKYEAYSKDMKIEARTMLELSSKELIPAMMRGIRRIADSANAASAAGADTSVQTKLLHRLTELLIEASSARDHLEEVTSLAERHPAGRQQAILFRDQVVPAMKALRAPVDAAEMIVDKDLWPLPSYADLMFEL